MLPRYSERARQALDQREPTIGSREEPMGEGRGLACLNKHDKDVTQSCKDALKAIGLRK